MMVNGINKTNKQRKQLQQTVRVRPSNSIASTFTFSSTSDTCYHHIQSPSILYIRKHNSH